MLSLISKARRRPTLNDLLAGRFIEIDVKRGRRGAIYDERERMYRMLCRAAIGGMQVSESVEGLERFPNQLCDIRKHGRDSPERLEKPTCGNAVRSPRTAHRPSLTLG